MSGRTCQFLNRQQPQITTNRVNRGYMPILNRKSQKNQNQYWTSLIPLPNITFSRISGNQFISANQQYSPKNTLFLTLYISEITQVQEHYTEHRINLNANIYVQKNFFYSLQSNTKIRCLIFFSFLIK